MSFLVGSTIRTTASFYAGTTLTDPTTITLKVRQPSGTETSYTYGAAQVTKSSTGVYYKDIALDSDGIWWFRWVGTGTVPDAEERSIVVPESAFSSP